MTHFGNSKLTASSPSHSRGAFARSRIKRNSQRLVFTRRRATATSGIAKEAQPRNIANAAKAEELERELERYVVAVNVILIASTNVLQIEKGAARMG